MIFDMLHRMECSVAAITVTLAPQPLPIFCAALMFLCSPVPDLEQSAVSCRQRCHQSHVI